LERLPANFKQALIFGSFHQGKEHEKRERDKSFIKMHGNNVF
jgi:hypothetical protein